MNIKRLILLPLLVLGYVTSATASGSEGDPEVLYRYRLGADLSFKLARGLNLNVAPEFRFEDGYDKFTFDGGLSYKVINCISIGATYRVIVDRVESATTTMTGFGYSNYESEYYHRYAFDATYKEKFGRFSPSFRVRYSNYTENEIDDKEFMRYRAKVDYNIPKCKITPFVSAELFHSFEEGCTERMRYSTGIDLKVSKEASFEFGYKLDYFTLKYKNANIFSVGYKYKF